VRVFGHLTAAGKLFTRALEVWESGAPANPASLDAARPLDLEASLRIDQRRLGEALTLLDRALAAVPTPAAAARLLPIRAKTLEELGDYEGAVETLRRAAPLIDLAADPRLPLICDFNLA
jgi:tetratricopeptide (TPR) repeat protein